MRASRNLPFAPRWARDAGGSRGSCLLESVTLGLLGGVLGVGVAYAGLRLVDGDWPGESAATERDLAGRLVAGSSRWFSPCSPGCSSVRFRCCAMRLRGSALTALGAMRTASVSRERQRGRNLLVVAQVAMALVLLISAVLMIRTFLAMRNVDPGFSDAPHPCRSCASPFRRRWLRDPQTVDADAEQHSGQASRRFPGCRRPALPLRCRWSGAEPNWDQIFVEGKNYEADESAPAPVQLCLAGITSSTAGTRLVAGHDFTWAEIYGLRPVEMVVRRVLPANSGAPRARRSASVSASFESCAWQEVVGVVQDVRENGVDQASPATVYWPSMIGRVLTLPRL